MTFTASSPLTAAQLNDYLMEQAVISCTSSTRPSSPNEGMTIYETDTDRILAYSGSAWVRVAQISATGRTGVRADRTASQTISVDTLSTINWDAETLDTDGFITPTSGTITIPSGLTGIYTVSMALDLSAVPVTLANDATEGDNSAFMQVVAGGKTWWQPFVIDVVGNRFGGSMSFTAPLAAADTIVGSVFHSATASIGVTGRIEAYRVGG
jgi:hypothetical protein